MESVLVSEDIDLDARPGATETCNRGLAGAPIVGAGCGAVGDITVIVAGAVEAAISEEVGVGEVGAELFRGGIPVVEGAGLVGLDVAGWDEDVVYSNPLTGVGHPERVIEGCGCLVVCKTVKVPVSL